jgi:EpsI family protein
MLEEETRSRLRFLQSKAVIIVTAVLLAEMALFYAVPTKEYIPTPPPLEKFAANVGPWQTVRQTPIDDYTQSFLKADDTLSRLYVGPGTVDLFVAFFKTQRGGVTPHSPKVCLPGNGWTPETSSIILIDVPGETAPIPVNRFIVTHDEQRSLVLYWYQNPQRVTANEYLSKFYLVYDALRYRRSDEALIRVITDIGGNDAKGAEEHALQFIHDVYLPLKRQMWTTQPTAMALGPPHPPPAAFPTW